MWQVHYTTINSSKLLPYEVHDEALKREHGNITEPITLYAALTRRPYSPGRCAFVLQRLCLLGHLF